MTPEFAQTAYAQGEEEFSWYILFWAAELGWLLPMGD